MLIIENNTDFIIDTKILEEISSLLTEKDLECIFVDDKSMKKLNFDTRNIDKSTDVLSFPLDNVPFAPLGSIVINIDMATKMANLYGHDTSDEVALLFIHGILHLLGFDHETDNGNMRDKEVLLIKKFSLPKSLIVRTNNEI